ncbi:MAG: maltotransferase domain-containing protein, partial [Burkholderiaceae bacterium]
MALDVLPWKRAIIENVTPQVDGGRFAAKSVVGDAVVVEADAFTDGHDRMRVRLTWHYEDGDNGSRGSDGRGAVDAGEVEMTALGNDRWRAAFTVSRLGRYRYGVMAWVDAFHTWRHDFNRREDPADIAVALQSGAQLIREAAARASVDDAERLKVLAARLAPDGDRHASGGEGRGAPGDERASDFEGRRELARSEELGALMDRYPDLRQVARLEQELTIVVEPVRARYGAWYEFFPRSAAAEPGRHGTFADCIAWLPRIAAMGFDIVYFPPIHPIGRVRRKGPNNTLTPGPDDPGSPWAIGADEGGHRAIHRELGTEADFRELVRKAGDLGLDIALDIAFQCAPDHPYVKDHPDWFRWRPDGTVQYAENPPKKYQDIYPFEFENADWKALFEELKGVVMHWIDCGVTVFRVDNPHTKPFAMWEWLITEVRRTHPEAIFLSEAFTRPRVMHRLAKLGFSQSYTYFTWRNTRAELTEYLTELH